MQSIKCFKRKHAAIDAPSRCTATDCLVLTLNMSRSFEVIHCKPHNQRTEAHGPLVHGTLLLMVRVKVQNLGRQQNKKDLSKIGKQYTQVGLLLARLHSAAVYQLAEMLFTCSAR